jgi:hypothetical protein
MRAGASHLFVHQLLFRDFAEVLDDAWRVASKC